jgi:hypothetical protein
MTRRFCTGGYCGWNPESFRGSHILPRRPALEDYRAWLHYLARVYFRCCVRPDTVRCKN